MTPGPVETAIRSRIRPGAVLHTPAKGSPFVVERIDNQGIVLLLGAKRAWTRLSWECLEGAPDFLRGQGWVPVGGSRLTEGRPDTLDEYLKGCIKRDTAAWVARVLADAGVVQLDLGPPVRVRLRSGF
jgi:hypothetical protein